MDTRLKQFLEVNKIMNKYQIGFRKNCRTTDHLLVLKTIIDCYKSNVNRFSHVLLTLKKPTIMYGEKAYFQTYPLLVAVRNFCA
jgi:hypothetical protein